MPKTSKTIKQKVPQQAVVLVAGGTAGHVIPALVLAEVLKEKKVRVVFITDQRGRGYFDQHDPYVLPVISLRGKGFRHAILALWYLVFSFFRSVILIIRLRASVCVGFGGYPSLSPCLAAFFCARPLIIHEQNRVVGLANRVLSFVAKRVLLSFPDTRRTRALPKYRVIGSPVQVQNTSQSKTQKITKGRLNILVSGGSLGAHWLGDFMIRALDSLPKKKRQALTVSHQCPANDVPALKDSYMKLGLEHDVAAFYDDMPRRLAWCDLFIGRSGGSTVAALMEVGRASILVPLPIAPDRQQWLNAEYLVKHNASILIEQGDEAWQHLAKMLESYLSKPQSLSEMGKQAARLPNRRCVNDFSDEILKICSA